MGMGDGHTGLYKKNNVDGKGKHFKLTCSSG